MVFQLQKIRRRDSARSSGEFLLEQFADACQAVKCQRGAGAGQGLFQRVDQAVAAFPRSLADVEILTFHAHDLRTAWSSLRQLTPLHLSYVWHAVTRSSVWMPRWGTAEKNTLWVSAPAAGPLACITLLRCDFIGRAIVADARVLHAYTRAWRCCSGFRRFV